jgi:hypothetical protein
MKQKRKSPVKSESSREKGAIMISDESEIRRQLARILTWEDAHVSFETATANFPAELRGKQPSGLPYSPWQILEHICRAQRDILDFCRDPNYRELTWPADYWPSLPVPPSPTAWDESIAQFQSDRKALHDLAGDSAIDLTARIPHGQGQTYFRELLLAADHTAYHTGEIVLIRRLLGIWESS